MLRVCAERRGNTSVLHLKGRIIRGQEIEELRDEVLKAGSSVLVLDLLDVDRIDAAGLGLLLTLREWANSRGIEFRLTNVTQLVQQVFGITCLDSVFDMSVDSLMPTSPVVERARAACC